MFRVAACLRRSVVFRLSGMVLLIGLVLGAQQAPAPVPDVHSAHALPPLTLQERIREYDTSLFNWERLGISAFSAGLGQWRDRPADWPQGAGGYARRFGDSWGRNAIRQTVSFAVADVLRDDQRYRPLGGGSILSRAWWALRWTVLTHSEDGKAVPNLPLFAGAYSTEFMANSWYPAAISHPQNALRRGNYVLLGAFGFNLWREFAPARLRHHH